MSLEIRTLDTADVADWLQALNAGFHRPPTELDAQEVELRAPSLDFDRTRGVWDGGRCVATFRSLAQELTVPGGATVAASAVTNVSVTSTHRRRGLAARMMAEDLAAAEERGDAVSILIAAEYPIYGRYGFGPATWVADWRVDVPRAALDRRYAGPDDGGRVDLATPAEVRAAGPELFDRVRLRTPGAIKRLPWWWQRNTGELVFAFEGPWTEPFFAFHRDADGRIDGLACWRIHDRPWLGKLSEVEAGVEQLIAATPAAERALWRFLLSLDWMNRLTSGHRPPDDVLPLLLGDPRAALINTNADFMWLRVLDTPAALSARTYGGGPAALVLDIRDPDGPAGGRFLLETDASGTAHCAPTSADPDLSLSVGDLGCLYLGDESPVRLAALGRLTEHHAEAARTADTLFRTPRRPWCPDVF
ncbi:Predicted acetyltransferase [Streptomyces sp. DvalAA-14]|uniref:GNAT family N-acetyltransferase n=1 Tax=unclassified Streptomyces TaxID=2593676 RepID=UPI00081B33D8|nr:MULTISPECIES: GNAT family N-acetyltransferase [unclassified Streptomyces]MYS22619.1 GNAT family N-acetyltransferase [Streptomyces sp. SID4948]SCE19320.1 Predicted acetyltransferase [Streptomyces sp. DvalAA-14]